MKFEIEDEDKKLLILLLIFLLLIASFIVGYLLGLKDVKVAVRFPLLFKGREIKAAVIDPGTTKSVVITPEGGSISVVDKNGVKATLIVPSGAVEDDVEVTMSALAESPVENEGGDENDPGVLIEPADLRLNIPGRLVFDFDPADDMSMFPVPVPASDLGEEEAGGLPSEPFTDPDLTPDERERRSTAQSRSVGDNAGVVHTDSSQDAPGKEMIYTPTHKSPEESRVETDVRDGGTYSYDNEVSEKEARENIEEVLNDPNATIEEVLEAAELAQGWGFEDLDQKSLEKIRQKMLWAKEQLEILCEDPRGNFLSKQDIIKMQEIAQGLGLDNVDTQFSNLLEKCRGYYSFSLTVYDLLYSASVCGFIDDMWDGSLTYSYSPPFSGGCSSKTPITFSLPPGGGLSTPSSYYFECTCCLGGSCGTSGSNISGNIFMYDGAGEISVPGYSAPINYSKACVVGGGDNQLPPLEPIPVN